MTPDARPDIREIRAVGIPVTDQDSALRFYADTLGFEVRVDVPMPQSDGRWIMLAPAGTAVMIALVLARADAPAGVQTGIRFHTPDAASTHAVLQARGVEVGELLQWPGLPPMFEVYDWDDNRFEIIE